VSAIDIPHTHTSVGVVFEPLGSHAILALKPVDTIHPVGIFYMGKSVEAPIACSSDIRDNEQS